MEYIKRRKINPSGVLTWLPCLERKKEEEIAEKINSVFRVRILYTYPSADERYRRKSGLLGLTQKLSSFANPPLHSSTIYESSTVQSRSQCKWKFKNLPRTVEPVRRRVELVAEKSGQKCLWSSEIDDSVIFPKIIIFTGATSFRIIFQSHLNHRSKDKLPSSVNCKGY